MLQLLTAHRHLPDRTKALGCWSFVLTALLVAGVYLLTWEPYQAPESAAWIGVDGQVNSDGSSWKPDRSLTRFGVRFSLPGVSARQVVPVYASTQAFLAAGLHKGSPVTLLVEPRTGEVIIRELTTVDGQVLYDDRVYRQVIKANNDAIRLNLIVLPVLALIGLGAGFFFRLRRPRAERLAP